MATVTLASSKLGSSFGHKPHPLNLMMQSNGGAWRTRDKLIFIVQPATCPRSFLQWGIDSKAGEQTGEQIAIRFC